MYLGQRVKKFKHVSAEITVFGYDKSSALARPLLSTLQKKQNQLTYLENKKNWLADLADRAASVVAATTGDQSECII